MATVTGFTAARMLEIENNTVVDGSIVGDDLILTTHGGTPINAGNVRGPQGLKGDTGDPAAPLSITNAQIANQTITDDKLANKTVDITSLKNFFIQTQQPIPVAQGIWFDVALNRIFYSSTGVAWALMIS